MNNVFVSTGALTLAQYPLTPQKLAATANLIRCDGYELSLHHTTEANAQAWASRYRKAEPPFHVLHIGNEPAACYGAEDLAIQQNGHEKLANDCGVARRMEIRNAVLQPFIPNDPQSFTKNSLAALSLAMRIANDLNVKLIIEIAPARGSRFSRFKKIAAAFPELKFALNVRAAYLSSALGQALNADWLWEKRRVAHIYLSDASARGDGEALHPGDGEIDFANILRTLARRGYRGDFTLDAPSVDPGDGNILDRRINQSIDLIRGMIA